MGEMAPWLRALFDEGKHFINHGAFYCPKEEMSIEATHIHYHYSSPKSVKGGILLNFCPICGQKMEKGITAKKDAFTRIVE